MKYEILAQDLQTLMDHQNDYPLHTNDSSIDWYSEFHPFDEVNYMDWLHKARTHDAAFLEIKRGAQQLQK